ncbi:tetraacyldisaccharide 4'-kinase [Rheinheimera mesophila]|uniref:Tetraacyldisaccharide 4'-kinase n=1 Tax=Rheinheimera mesophila TaxID=1547515 RepID=A0A3P3QNW1_9GAMM|nr:tetraacyldisaccharide 4'-kinase [Rheinheimera mesophila]KKL02848.1 tetraacyldisaccharide 4'-kinase [Rheinheimera mesophila]RRJ22922.1 tetraacyldisaccharide 4'-kinase [Rheinheimera mesophila]
MNWWERGWYRQHPFTLLFWPLSLLYRLVATLRRFGYQRGWFASFAVEKPVVIVGNISVGGTGKTPFTLWLCQFLTAQGFTPGIVSRGYGARITAPVRVTALHQACDVGDEPLLLASKSQCPVVVCPDRVAAAQYLLETTDCDIVISDDGLQHYRLKRDLELVLIDGQRGLGNQQLLPAGPLREPVSRLKKVDAVIVNSGEYALAKGTTTPQHQMQLKPVTPQALDGQSQWQAQAVTLVAAIGNPQRFVDTVKSIGIEIKSTAFFRDHFAFDEQSLADIEGPVLMTEKDAVKCRAFAKAHWYYLPVEADLSDEFKFWLQHQLRRWREK